MQRRSLVGVVIGLCLGVGLELVSAQAVMPPTQMPRDYSGVRKQVDGIFVTPVANAPFSATVQIVSHEKLPDGSEHVTTTNNRIARTSSGRIYNERRQMVPVEFKGQPILLSAHIYDPSSRQSITLNPFTHLAREMTLRGPERTPQQALPPAARPQVPGSTETKLGTKSLDGLELEGMERIRTIDAASSGTGKAVTVTDDYWYSPELSIYLLIQHNDPRTGEQLVAVTGVDRTEPPAEMFAVPAKYKIVDETTDEAPAAAR